MKAIYYEITAAVTIGIAALCAVAQEGVSVPTNTRAHYSRAELYQLRRDAHTPQQYEALAEYFQYRQRSYQQQADLEKKEWDRRSQSMTGVGVKYPRPVDSAKNLYQYYAYEADQMGESAAHYKNLAQTAVASANR